MKLEIFNNKLLLQIILLCLVQPDYLKQIEFTDKLYSFLTILCVLFVFFLIYIEKKWTNVFLWIICFYGYILFTTSINNYTNIIPYFKINVLPFVLCLVFFLWMNKNPKVLIEAFEVLEIYVYVNLITILLFPEGLYESGLYTKNWFLGYKNPQIRTILPILSISIINSYIKFGKISLRVYLLYVASIATFILINSVTSLIGIIFFTLVLFLFHKDYIKIPKFLNLLSFAIITLFIDYLIIFYHIQYKFSFFFTNILNRSLSFTARTTIWNIAIKHINESLLIGHGYMTTNEFANLYGYITYTHPHNYYLYLFTMGGIILFLIFIIGIIIANNQIMRCFDNFCCKVIFICLISFLIMGISEALVSTVLLYPMLILGMNIEKLCKLK